jgi:hypothetical protein
MRRNISGEYFCILSSAKRNAYRSLCSATLPRVRQIEKSCASNGPSAQPAPRRRSKIMRLNWNLRRSLSLLSILIVGAGKVWRYSMHYDWLRAYLR